jgi:hypothetical protein
MTSSFVSIATLLLLSSPCLAVSPDDYAFPIGRIDSRVLCKPNQPTPPNVKPTKESLCLAQFKGVVARVRDDLIFKLDNGKTRVIKSNVKACQSDAGACVIYELLGFIPAARQFILSVSFYESQFALLVSQRNGAVTELEGYPRLSPTGKRFVTVAASDAWDIDSPIAIFSTNDPPKLEWRYPQPAAYEQYSFDGWDGEDRVKLHTTTKPNVETDVTRSGEGWVLKRPNGSSSFGTSSPLPPLKLLPTASAPRPGTDPQK